MQVKNAMSFFHQMSRSSACHVHCSHVYYHIPVLQVLFTSSIPEIAEILGRRQKYGGVYKKERGKRYANTIRYCIRPVPKCSGQDAGIIQNFRFQVFNSLLTMQM